MKAFVQTFAVEGAPLSDCAGFLDMLRFDSCFPETQAEVAKLTSAARKSERVTVRVERICLEFVKPPTSARWASFGWKVLADTVEHREVK